jgi:U3 small nucleolar RNA-associated protein 15
VKKTISRFKEIAYSGCFREDGQLLVAGDGSGLIQVFDSNSRTVMRTFIGHSRAVHVTKFSSYSQVMSSSDDCTVRCWDLPTGEELISLSGHKDYIRSGDVHSSSPELWLTGSYDHTVKLWDLRSKETTFTMCHGAPVESVLLFPGGVMALSAGGNKIKVWDLLSGGRELYSFSNHQKTITSLAFDSFHRRILSGSLDHHVKIYDASTYKVLHGIKYTAPVLCLASSPTGRHLVVGMSDGCVSIRYRPEIKPPPAPQAPPRGGTHKYIVRGPLAKPKEVLCASLGLLRCCCCYARSAFCVGRPFY